MAKHHICIPKVPCSNSATYSQVRMMRQGSPCSKGKLCRGKRKPAIHKSHSFMTKKENNIPFPLFLFQDSLSQLSSSKTELFSLNLRAHGLLSRLHWGAANANASSANANAGANAKAKAHNSAASPVPPPSQQQLQWDSNDFQQSPPLLRRAGNQGMRAILQKLPVKICHFF